jgi:hypothetical protein
MNLIFEKVGDINVKYAYIFVYQDICNGNPFMEIGINDINDKLTFTIFENKNNIILTQDDWSKIYKKANEFYKEELENAKYY